MKMSVKQRRARRRIDQPATALRNRNRKDPERARRDSRMVQKLRAGKLPYTQTVMSWLSAKLDKKASKITPDDVKALME